METILVPTDFSEAADNAVNYAVRLAKHFDARIILLNVFSVPYAVHEPLFQQDLIPVFSEASKAKLRETKNRIHKSIDNRIRIECVSECSTVFESIASVASEKDADLIVMGIVGEAGNFKARVVGSTAITVARKLDIPTFIIPQGVKYEPIKKITFACDLEGTEDSDLIYVVRLFCKIFEAELEIVNIGSPMEKVSSDKALTYLFIEDKLQNMRHNIYHVNGEDAAAELENYFKSYPTDLVALSPKKHGLFYNIFHHSITNTLAFHLKKPILSIH
jgi:nucleotide-binding universal stress UspA family protein